MQNALHHPEPRHLRLLLVAAMALASWVRFVYTGLFAPFAICVLLPLSAALLLWELLGRQVDWDGYALLAVAMAGAFALSSLLRRAVSVSRLAFCCASMAAVGILPRRAERRDMRREGLCVLAVLDIGFVPLFALAVASVFVARPIRIPMKNLTLGIEAVGKIGSQISIFANPNPSAQIAVLGILFSIYGLYNRPRRWVKWLEIVAIVVFAMGLAHGQSRAANIALAISVGALAFRAVYLRLKGGGLGIPLGLAAWAAAAALVLALLNAIFTVDVLISRSIHADALLSGIESRAFGSAAPEVFTNGREGIWRVGLSYLARHPSYLLVGMGSGNIMARMPEAANNSLHSAFLEVLARGGIPMLACVLAQLLLLVRPSVRMLTGESAGEDRGAHMMPIILGAVLILALVEDVLFTSLRLSNAVFFLAAGWVMRCGRRADRGEPARRE